MKTIEVPHSKTKKQKRPLIHSPQTPSQFRDAYILPKDAYDELYINRQQFKILTENLPYCVALYKIIYDNQKPVDFILLVSNKAYKSLHSFGIDRTGKRALQLNPEIKNDAINWLKIYSKVVSTGKPTNFEMYCKQLDQWYSVYIFSPREPFFVATFSDITKQKKKIEQEKKKQEKAKQQLLFTEKRYRKLYETTQDGIMARDVDGKMIDCNPAYAKMLGYSKKELKNLSLMDYLPEKWHQQRTRIVNKILKTGRSIVFEREYKRKDGVIFPASVRTWRLTDENGKIVGIWSIVRDITEQKEKQKILSDYAVVLEKIVEERTNQLKDSERLAAIGQTAGMVGHDLRNPLQTVVGELFLAKNEAKSLPDNTTKDALLESIRAIEEQVSYMDKIVSDLQAFVQPIKIDKKPIDLKEFVLNVLGSVELPHNIIVETVITDGFPQIKADLQLLKRVLINLLTNSVQAMPQGGKLTVTGHVNSGKQISIAVKDTGVGIPDEIQSKIFTPLFTTKPRGQGFGLAVCKRVIEAHSGVISFESTVGKGTVFTIQFPLG